MDKVGTILALVKAWLHKTYFTAISIAVVF